ncbi:MerR family transcriptional regulator [Prauserella muralis]|uniref:Transcriptional regulator n=1 Tax=Prauserella muralis TaxID=588067 RepID=A0A2V4B0R9_9PSEU|nr:MerR family transcriptional regulator [Prauserella muralis]PXY27613.1 transcriptional regulator [Prauserella muralis]TWE22653.1 DNA polymerase III beta subunit-like protein [Prauserella muralis]
MHSISAFARLTGLTPSALRFYDDCAVLTPARVDPSTGYRHYSDEQVPRAVQLRRLRAAGLPLAEVAAVLDGDPAGARAVLDTHAHRLRVDAEAAQAALEAARAALPGGGGHTEVRVGGAELAGAVRQVAPSAARTGEFPALRCVLVELSGTRVRLVATDRYRLAVRELTPHAVSGGPASLLVPVPALVETSAWAARHAEVTLRTGDGESVLLAGGERRTLPVSDAEFPAYREVLAGLEGPRRRVLTGRAELAAALDAEDGSAVVLRAQPDTLGVGATTLPAVCSESLRIAFDPAVLGPALEASVGPDVLLEIATAETPVLVRSADQGSFTTLVMPVQDPEVRRC